MFYIKKKLDPYSIINKIEAQTSNNGLITLVVDDNV